MEQIFIPKRLIKPHRILIISPTFAGIQEPSVTPAPPVTPEPISAGKFIMYLTFLGVIMKLYLTKFIT